MPLANNESTVMQYTGVEDMNGKDIYEGDIVTNHKGPTIYAFKVVCEEGVCGDKVSESRIDALRDLSPDEYLEVIGNIYQNPELLN
jgi:uncharacterized phage protein (TIGR01671 family)